MSRYQQKVGAGRSAVSLAGYKVRRQIQRPLPPTRRVAHRSRCSTHVQLTRPHPSRVRTQVEAWASGARCPGLKTAAPRCAHDAPQRPPIDGSLCLRRRALTAIDFGGWGPGPPGPATWWGVAPAGAFTGGRRISRAEVGTWVQ